MLFYFKIEERRIPTIETILLGADSAGKALKDAIHVYLKDEGYDVIDIGCRENITIDYDQVAHDVAKRIASSEFKRALLFCGTGMGVSIVANKHQGVYCALCESVMAARLCRTINNCNVLAIGGLTTTPYKAKEMVKAFLETQFAMDERVADSSFLQEAYHRIQRMEDDLYHECSSQ